MMTRCDVCADSIQVTSLTVQVSFYDKNTKHYERSTLCETCRDVARETGYRTLEMVRERRRAAKPRFAELEALGDLHCPCPFGGYQVEFRNGDEPNRKMQMFKWTPASGHSIHFYKADARYSGMLWLLSADGLGGIYVSDRDVPRIHAELVALRDSESDPRGREEKPEWHCDECGCCACEGDRRGTTCAKCIRTKPDPYAKCREADLELELASIAGTLRCIAKGLHGIRMRGYCFSTAEDEADSEPMTMAEFRKALPELLAALAREGSKL